MLMLYKNNNFYDLYQIKEHTKLKSKGMNNQIYNW